MRLHPPSVLRLHIMTILLVLLHLHVLNLMVSRKVVDSELLVTNGKVGDFMMCV